MENSRAVIFSIDERSGTVLYYRISDLENGKGTIQIQKLLKVVQALGLGLFLFSPWDNE